MDAVYTVDQEKGMGTSKLVREECVGVRLI